MKSLLLGLALIVAPCAAFADESPQPVIDNSSANAPVDALTPDLYLIHAMHLANLSANRAVIGTYLAPGSQALREQGFPILGRSAFLEIALTFLVKPYGVDLSVEALPSELGEEKILVDIAIEALNNSDETTVDQAFYNALDVIKSFEARILETAVKEGVSPGVRDFALANYGKDRAF